MFPCSSVALVEIELIIGFFLVFVVMEPQGNCIEKLYDPGEYKLTWMFVVAFSALHIYFYIYQTYIFATFIKYILELLETLFCENVC